MTTTFVVGGKLGDLLHTMWVVKRNWDTTGKKGIVIMSERYDGERFGWGLAKTFEEVAPFLEKQAFIEKVELDNGQDYTIDVNLNEWRKHSKGDQDWTTMLSRVYKLERVDPLGGWLTSTPHSDLELEQTVVVHQSYRTRINPNYPWEAILKNNKCLFVTCNWLEWEDFQYKHLVSCYLAKDLSEMAAIIGNAKGFCGNQSSPLALAAALGKVCYCQLYWVDKKAYMRLASHIFYDNLEPPSHIIKLR